jgi:hypothetical protein
VATVDSHFRQLIPLEQAVWTFPVHARSVPVIKPSTVWVQKDDITCFLGNANGTNQDNE